MIDRPDEATPTSELGYASALAELERGGANSGASLKLRLTPRPPGCFNRLSPTETVPT